MAFIDFQYQAGTIEAPQNTESTQARWSATDKVHFPDDHLTPIPSFNESEGASGSAPIRGTCRAQWGTRLGGSPSIAGAYYMFGTHSNLYAEYRAVRYNITPFAGQRNISLGDDPLTVANGDATMTIAIADHGLSVGDSIAISGAADVGGVNADSFINIEHIVATVPNASSVTVEIGASAGSDATGGGSVAIALTIEAAATLSNAVNTTDTSATVTIDYTGHGLQDGDRVKLTGLAATGGVPADELNGEHIITIDGANRFTFTVTTAATSTVTGGGGTNGHIFTQMSAGNMVQEFFSGYSAGEYGAGLYGTNRFSDTTQAYPRISSFDNFGNRILYCAGDYDAGDGQKIYEWDGNRDLAPTPLLDAPENCNWIAVIANQVVALCGTNIIIALTDPTTGRALWPEIPSTSPIGDVIPVQRATQLLSIAPLGEKSAIVFAPEPYLLRLVGGVWDLEELGAEFPILAPAAFCRFNDGVMWYGQDGNYYFCNGGNVRKMVNRQNGEYVRGRTNTEAVWTMFLMQDQKHEQFWHYYASTGQSNPDSYVVYNPLSESYTVGNQERTSGQRPNIVDQRFYMTNVNTIYSSFTTEPVDFEWSAKSAFFYVDSNYRFKVTRLMPDSVVNGSVNIRLLGKEHAQDEEIDYGTYTMDASSTSITVRAAGRLLALEFSGNSDFTIPNLKLNVERMGRRRL